MFQVLKNLYQNNPLFKGSVLTLAAIVFLLVFMRIILSPVIIYGATSWLEKQGIDAEIDDVRFDFFNGSISLINASGKKNNSPVFNINRINIHWQWSPLADNIIVIPKIKISGLAFTAKQYTDAIDIGSIKIPLGETDKPEDNKTTQTAWAASLEKTIFTDFNICYVQYNSAYESADKNSKQLDYCIQLGEMDWKGPIQYSMNTASKNTSSLPLSSRGELSISRLHMLNREIKAELVNFKSLRLSGIDISDAEKLALGNMTLNDLNLLQIDNTDKDHKNYTLSLSHLNIENTRFSNNRLAINSININGISNTLVRNEDGSWEYKKWLLQSNQEKLGTSKAPVKKTDKPFTITLNTLKLDTDKPIQFIDNSTDPVMKIALSQLNIKTENIDSTKPDTFSRFMLSAETSEHGTIDFKGEIQPFADPLSFNSKGKIRGLDLRLLTPFIKKAIGHIIKSGQLDANLKLLANKGILDSNIDLTLYHFNLKPISQEDAEKLNASSGILLNQTLALLRDKDDSIHLNIPVTGDINSPDFDPMDAIVKATSKAATAALINFYTPYGLIYTGGNLLFDLATALNFDPITFTPGSSDLQQENKAQLDKLAKLMSEKPGIHLSLCGVSNLKDTDALFPELEKSREQKKDEEKIVLNKEQKQKLDQLAEDRQEKAKDYLIKEKAIEHSRLILCAPEYRAEEDAIAGVEISI